MFIAVLWLLQAIVLSDLVSASSYQEHLTLQPLPQSSLLAAFNFRTNISLSDFEKQNYNLFPRSLGQILLHTHTEELHLRFALGRWDAENWGERPRRGRTEGGTGVELWAWLQAPSTEVAESRWFTLTNALSGLFCASLNFVDRTKTIRPAFTFEREGNTPVRPLHLLHGALPHEVVCTENLTPFLKLMPCKGKAGISSLLDGHKLFDASWQTMAIDARKICATDGGNCQIEIEQTVDMVLDIERSIRSSNDPIPRPPPIESIPCNSSKTYNNHDTCFPENRVTEPAWTLGQIFGTRIHGSCPLSTRIDTQPGEVELLLPAKRKVSTEPVAKDVASSAQKNQARFYRIPNEVDFDVKVDEYPIEQDISLTNPVLSADRTITGYGQERGGMHTVLTNLSPAELEVVYLDSLPWFMKPYLHTLTAVVTPSSSSSSSLTHTTNTTSPITNILYRPARDRVRGTHLELRLRIPAHSQLTLTYYFEKAILRYTEYPPDANRGFDVAPAVIRILPPPTNALHPWLGRRGAGKVVPAWGGESAYVRTTSLLLPLPTPDFSMPYNVIILTSTVIAMGFGSIFNLLTRRLVGADEGEGPKIGVVVREKIAALVGRIRAARRKETAGKDESHDGGGGEKEGNGGTKVAGSASGIDIGAEEISKRVTRRNHVE